MREGKRGKGSKKRTIAMGVKRTGPITLLHNFG